MPVTPQNTSSSNGLAQFVTNTYQTPNGGQVTLDSNGNVQGYSPAQGYSIDTSGSVPSEALSNAPTVNDINNLQSSYADLVNAVANAQGYSPAYLQALQAQYNAQNQGAYLGSVGAGISANVASGNGYTGYSTSQAQTAGNIAQAMNTQQEALNTQQQTEAQIALNTQQLARTGNIAAAQTELASSPTGISGQNAINQYQQLQQEYPNAGIPPFNPQGDPLAQYQMAYNMVATSPAYQSQFTSTYATPGGGTGILNKLSLGALQQNSDGTYTLVSGAANVVGSTNATIAQNAATQYSGIGSALTAIQGTTGTMTQFMDQYGLNQSNIPIANQIANAVKSNTAPAGAVAAFQTDLQDLQQAYAGFLAARSGSTAGVNEEAQSTINAENLSPAQLQLVSQQILQDGQNAQQGALTQIQTALQGLQTGTPQSSEAGASGVTNTSNVPGSFASGTGWN